MRRLEKGEDFGPLADKGWELLRQRLDEVMPVRERRVVVRPAYVVLTALLFFLLGSGLAWLLIRPGREVRRDISPLPPIIHQISFVAPPPVLELPLPGVRVRSTGKQPSSVLRGVADVSSDNASMVRHIPIRTSSAASQSQRSTAARLRVAAEQLAQVPLPPKRPELDVVAPLPDLKWEEGPTAFAALKSLIDDAELGVHSAVLASGKDALGLSGGLSVGIPLSKRFSFESGVDFTAIKYAEPVPSWNNTNFGMARVTSGVYSLRIKSRLRQSVHIPFSVRYHATRKLALSGGVDLGLLVSQRLYFASSHLYNSDFIKSYRHQLEESELSRLKRFNVGVRTGVVWSPLRHWRLGLYYGRNIFKQYRDTKNELALPHDHLRLQVSRHF